MSKYFKLYQVILNRRPLLTQSIQTGILMGAGDIIAQQFFGDKTKLQQHDYTRTVEFLTLGTIFVGPSISLWYRTLSRIIPGGGTVVTLKKVGLDQLAFAPSFLYVFVKILSELDRRRKPESAKDYLKVEATYFDILMANYKLWPVVQLGNFYLTPLNYQSLVTQVVALFWNIYLSWKTHSPPK